MALNPKTTRRIKVLFSRQDWDEVASLLQSKCGQNLPFLGNATPHQLERVRFAALKLSGGSIEQLYEAIALAQTDWRDLLMAAGFGESIHAHKKWLRGRVVQSYISHFLGRASKNH